MPLHTNTIDLETARDEQQERMQDCADRQLEYPQGSDGAKRAASEGQQAERFASGLSWAIEEFGADTTVTIGALTTGERNLVQSIASDAEGTGVSSNAYVAVGTRDAPFLEHDSDNVPQNESAIRQTTAAVTDLHPAFVDYLEQEISDLSRVGSDTGKTYRELVQERRNQQTSPKKNG